MDSHIFRWGSVPETRTIGGLDGQRDDRLGRRRDTFGHLRLYLVRARGLRGRWGDLQSSHGFLATAVDRRRTEPTRLPWDGLDRRRDDCVGRLLSTHRRGSLRPGIGPMDRATIR